MRSDPTPDPQLVSSLLDYPTDMMVRYATRGTLFSIQFTSDPGTLASWSVHRIVRHLRDIREASIR